MMSDIATLTIRRMPDAASPSSPHLADHLRRWTLNQRANVEIDCGTLIKRGVRVAVAKTGSLKVGKNCTIHERVRFLLTMPQPRVVVGDWVNIGFETFIGAKTGIEIGDYTVIAPRCYIVDTEHGFAANDVILNQRSTFAPTKIGRDCYLGTGTVVTKGVTINDGAVIGANSVVTSDIGPYEIWAGAPARFIRKRN